MKQSIYREKDRDRDIHRSAGAQHCSQNPEIKLSTLCSYYKYIYSKLSYMLYCKYAISQRIV